jgi:hypothetical protein
VYCIPLSAWTPKNETRLIEIIASRSIDRLFGAAGEMKIPRFSPNQLILILLMGVVVAMLAVYRYFTMN